jgi:hypothetical protein
LADRFWRLTATARLGRKLYLAHNPVRTSLSTTAPRIVLQCIFFSLVGGVVGGDVGKQYAFVGSVAFAAMASTLASVCDVPMEDTWNDTYFRIQGGVVSAAATYVCRALPYAIEGIALSLVALCAGGPILGLGRVTLSLLPLFPLYALLIVTSLMAGVAVAALAVASNADVLLGNLSAYVVLAVTGMITPVTKWLAPLGYLLPTQHGLAAVRAALAGRPWAGDALLELTVGACWLVLAVWLLARAERRARA